MAKGKLFEYAVLYHPKATKEQNERGESPKSEVLIEPKTVMALSPGNMLRKTLSVPTTLTTGGLQYVSYNAAMIHQ